MKLFLATLIAMLSATLVIAAPSAGSDMEAFDIAVSKFMRRDESSCEECEENLGVCIKYAVTPGQTGCERSCVNHMCRKYPECRDCDAKFDHCDRDRVVAPV